MELRGLKMKKLLITILSVVTVYGQSLKDHKKILEGYQISLRSAMQISDGPENRVLGDIFSLSREIDYALFNIEGYKNIRTALERSQCKVRFLLPEVKIYYDFELGHCKGATKTALGYINRTLPVLEKGRYSLAKDFRDYLVKLEKSLITMN